MVGKLYVEERVSAKTGNKYLALVFKAENGYELVVSYDSRTIAQFLMKNN